MITDQRLTCDMPCSPGGLLSQDGPSLSRSDTCGTGKDDTSFFTHARSRSHYIDQMIGTADEAQLKRLPVLYV